MNAYLYISVQGSILVAGILKGVQPEELWCSEGGKISCVVRVEGNERLLVGIVARVVNLQKN
jgi:hypothetical protein